MNKEAYVKGFVEELEKISKKKIDLTRKPVVAGREVSTGTIHFPAELKPISPKVRLKKKHIKLAAFKDIGKRIGQAASAGELAAGQSDLPSKGQSYAASTLKRMEAQRAKLPKLVRFKSRGQWSTFQRKMKQRAGLGV